MSIKPASFSLLVKVFVVKTYYASEENMQTVLERLYERYKMHCYSESNVKALRQLILAFEATGNISKPFYYEIEDVVPEPVAAEETETVIHVEYVDLEGNEIIAETSSNDHTEVIEHVREELEIIRQVEVEVEDDEEEEEEEEQEEPPKQKKKKMEISPSKTKNALYQCPTCQKKFATKQICREHISLHKAEEWSAQTPKFICEICGKVSTTNSHHRMHLKIHSDERPFQCDECPSNFSRKQALVRHKMLHTGEMSYKCNYCGVSFHSYSSHQIHVRRHTGEKPHACKHCGERYISLAALNVSGQLRFNLQTD